MRRVYLSAVDVLNACRRHEIGHVQSPTACRSQRTCSTPVGVMSRSLDQCWIACDARCAQRLSASSIGSRPRSPGFARVPSRCSTPVGVMDRVSRDALDMGRAPFRTCSTPVGVMRSVTRDVAIGACSSVLNACRRHESVTRASATARERMCSTPVGVMSRSRRAGSQLDMQRCAQRLSAS